MGVSRCADIECLSRCLLMWHELCMFDVADDINCGCHADTSFLHRFNHCYIMVRTAHKAPLQIALALPSITVPVLKINFLQRLAKKN